MDESAQGELVSYGQLTNIRSRNESELGSERGFLPIDDGTWTTASIAPEWLAALTPQAANVSEGYTTISSTLEAMGVDQIYTNEKWDKARVAVESLLAATTADGMSRIGLADNPFDLTLATDSPNQFLDDGIAVVRPTPSAEDPDFTELHWAITVSGYAFKADQNAHYLALAVLFVHLLVALAHIAYVIITRTAPVAWGTSEELLVLAQSSPPTQMALQDTCGGIQSTKTFRKLVKVRALKDEKVKAGEETVHMVYEGDYDHGMYEQCEVKRLYGAK